MIMRFLFECGSGFKWKSWSCYRPAARSLFFSGPYGFLDRWEPSCLRQDLVNSTIINVLCDVLGSAGGSSECGWAVANLVPSWQVIQTCRISQCLWWTWAWIPYLRLSSGIVCRQWRDGFWRFFDEFYLLDDLLDLSVPHQKGIPFWAQAQGHQLPSHRILRGEAFVAIPSLWMISPFIPDFFGTLKFVDFLYVHASYQTKTTGSSMTATILAINWSELQVENSSSASYGLPWHDDVDARNIKKYYTSSETRFFSDLDGTLMDTVIYCPYQLVLGISSTPSSAGVRAVRAVYRPPSMACTWHPLCLGFHLIAVAHQNWNCCFKSSKWNILQRTWLNQIASQMCFFRFNMKHDDSTLQFPQVMFDYPTVADLTDFIVAQFSEGDDEAEGAVGGRFPQQRFGHLW